MPPAAALIHGTLTCSFLLPCQVDERAVVSWVPPAGASTSGSSLALVVSLDALEAERDARELKVTCVTSHPPYTGPLEYVDIQRKEVTGEC